MTTIAEKNESQEVFDLFFNGTLGTKRESLKLNTQFVYLAAR